MADKVFGGQEASNKCGVQVPTYPKDLVAPGPNEEAIMIPCEGEIKYDEATGIGRCSHRGHRHAPKA
jgi:hypothetical protein